MTLSEIVNGLDDRRLIGPETEIIGITHDSRQVQNGFCFVCLEGLRFDGHEFAMQAVQQGANTVLVQRKLDLPPEIAQIIVKDSRAAMAHIAANFYGNPARKLKLIGITGTNGKTTTTHMVKAVLETAGYKMGMMGTNANYIGQRKLPQQLTTPDPVEFHALLAEMVREQCDAVVMEVSAHALALRKMEGVKFDVAVFTNFTQDHLDYFGTMEEYFEAKKRLFAPDMCRMAVINADSEWSHLLSDNPRALQITYGIENEANISAADLKLRPNGMRFSMRMMRQNMDISLKLAGRFNVYNCMAAAGACYMLGVPAEKILEGLQSIEGVSGRFELLPVPGKDYIVVLDYAHSPDSLKNALDTARELVGERKLICVFGCGGDRDKEKRPLMGEISCRAADYTIVTTDNPRFEAPEEILEQIAQGCMAVNGHYITMVDRRQAIEHALNCARGGDIVIIAGKGHEEYQDILGVKHPFSDKEVVAEYMMRG